MRHAARAGRSHRLCALAIGASLAACGEAPAATDRAAPPTSGRTAVATITLPAAAQAAVPEAGAAATAPPRNPRAPAPYAGPGRRPVARVIVLGDSISAGLGATERRLSYACLLMHNDPSAYPQEGQRDLVHLFGPGLQLLSVATHGHTTHDVRHRQLNRLLAPPEREDMSLGPLPVRGHSVVLITIGGNDVRRLMRPGQSLDSRAMQGSIDALAETVAFFRDRSIFPDGVSIYLGNVYDVTDGTDRAHACLRGLTMPGLVDALEAWDRAFQALAAQNDIVLVDLLQLFHGHGFNYADPTNAFFSRQDPTLWLSARDCIHPNNLGHHMLRRAFYRAIAADFAAAPVADAAF